MSSSPRESPPPAASDPPSNRVEPQPTPTMTSHEIALMAGPYIMAHPRLDGPFDQLRKASLFRDFRREVVLLLLEAFAELEADEAADLHVLADLRDQLLLDLIDRLVRVLHEGLIEEADVLHPLRDLTLDHLLDDGLGLARLLRLGEEHLALAVDHVLRDLFLAHELRAHRGDLHRDVAGEALEVVVARDEVGLAVDLDEDADAAAAVDVRDDRALGRLARRLLRGLREALLAQVVDRLVDVARHFL